MKKGDKVLFGEGKKLFTGKIVHIKEIGGLTAMFVHWSDGLTTSIFEDSARIISVNGDKKRGNNGS